MAYYAGTQADELLPDWQTHFANVTTSHFDPFQTHLITGAAGLTVTIQESITALAQAHRTVTILCGVPDSGTIVSRAGLDTIQSGASNGTTLTNSSGRVGDFVTLSQLTAATWTVQQQKGEWTLA